MATLNIKYPVLLDGGTGSELIKRGMPAGVCPEKWALDNPEALADVQSSYANAGSNAVLTCTFHCNSHCLGDYGLSKNVEEYNPALIRLSKRAVNGETLVLGDISPAALLVKPMGEYDFEYIYNVYSQQIRAMETEGVDGYIIETVMTLAEMRAIVLAVKDNSNKPVYTTFTVNESGRTQLSGTDILAGLITIQAMGVDAFGMNCSMGSKQTLQQIRRIAPYAAVPLIAKPNAGMPIVKDGVTTYDCTPEEFASYTEDLAKAGVRFFGGCCGTDPEYIAALRTELDKIDFSALAEVEKADCPIMLAGNMNAYLLDADATITEVACTDGFCDDCDDIEGIVKINVSTKADLEIFADNAAYLDKPLCLTGDDEAVFEGALRLYQGRACYDGSGKVSHDFVQRMVKKYGLLLLK